MFSSDAIAVIESRVGWAKPMPTATFTVEAAVTNTTSGRTFRGFHKLATLENMFACFGDGATTGINTAFVEFVTSMKHEAACKVLNQAFTLNERANYGQDYEYNRTDLTGLDYSSRVISRPDLFDEVYGCQVAIMAIQTIITSTRRNDVEKRLNMSYDQIKGELEGFFTENGRPIATGLKGEYVQAMEALKKVLFPPLDDQSIIIDRTHMW